MQTRNTEQKKIIFENISSRCDHPTVQMIYDSIKLKNPEIGIATIYRNIKTLTDNDQIKKIVTSDNVAHYDLATNDHVHLVCAECGKIIDINADELLNVSIIEKKYDFILDLQDIQVHGICNNCNKKKIND